MGMGRQVGLFLQGGDNTALYAQGRCKTGVVSAQQGFICMWRKKARLNRHSSKVWVGLGPEEAGVAIVVEGWGWSA